MKHIAMTNRPAGKSKFEALRNFTQSLAAIITVNHLEDSLGTAFYTTLQKLNDKRTEYTDAQLQEYLAGTKALYAQTETDIWENIYY